jgi:hypothetical protein
MRLNHYHGGAMDAWRIELDKQHKLSRNKRADRKHDLTLIGGSRLDLINNDTNACQMTAGSSHRVTPEHNVSIRKQPDCIHSDG